MNNIDAVLAKLPLHSPSLSSQTSGAPNSDKTTQRKGRRKINIFTDISCESSRLLLLRMMSEMILLSLRSRHDLAGVESVRELPERHFSSGTVNVAMYQARLLRRMMYYRRSEIRRAPLPQHEVTLLRDILEPPAHLPPRFVPTTAQYNMALVAFFNLEQPAYVQEIWERMLSNGVRMTVRSYETYAKHLRSKSDTDLILFGVSLSKAMIAGSHQTGPDDSRLEVRSANLAVFEVIEPALQAVEEHVA